LSATGRRLVVVDEGEVDDDLVRDMVEVQTSGSGVSDRDQSDQPLRT
jgi:predicted site-specific integrase-resolvase